MNILKDHSDKKIEKYYVDIRDIIAENVCNGVFDCDNAYLYGYKLQGFMTGLCGMGYSLLRDIKKDLPCVIALEKSKMIVLEIIEFIISNTNLLY